MINEMTKYYEEITSIFSTVNDKNQNIVFFSYFNNSYKIDDNKKKIDNLINENNNFTIINVCVKSFFSEDEIYFLYNREFYKKSQLKIIKVIFQNNYSDNFDNFLQFLNKSKTYNFYKLIDDFIEEYCLFVKLLPKNIFLKKENIKENNKCIHIRNLTYLFGKYDKQEITLISAVFGNLELFKKLNEKLKKLKIKKAWSISTTVRNPERLRNFLITLKEIEAKEWCKDTQLEFQIRLIKNRFYGFGSTLFYTGLSQTQIDLINNVKKNISYEDAKDILITKNYVDADMRGRNSFKPLEKIGLASIVDKKVKITSLGEYLLSEDYDFGELFFKSFLKWQYPNPVDRDFKDKEIYDVKPFILSLHLINEVNKICKAKEIKPVGISKLEFEIFGQTLLNYKDLKTQAETLVKFRIEFKKIKLHKDKKEFIKNYIDEFLYEYVNIDHNNLSDYADNTIRYFRLTRLIYIRGGGFYIDLEPRRMVEINALLNTYNGSSEKFTKERYIEYISDINLPLLPWDSESEKKKIIDAILKDIGVLESELQMQEFIKDKNIEELREYRKKLQNLKIKKELQNISKIDETIDALKNIRNLDLKPSIALEKYITMALNIINDAKEIKANSLVGDDNEFIFTAPANKPDIECYYDSFNSICEVTMLNGRDQWHNEGQPVMRHFRDFENASDKESNYCLFIAPKMHRDTINTFWFSLKYEYEGTKQKIVPFTINQIIEILEVIKKLKENNKQFSHLEFKKLLDDIVSLKNEVSNSDEFLRAIPSKIYEFKTKM